MNKQRTQRISEELRKEIDRIIRNEVSDPRIKGTYSVTRVDLTNDLSQAKVYVSVFEDENSQEFMQALQSAAGFIKKTLSKNVIIRRVPQLIFIKDDNIAYGSHMAKFIDSVIEEDKAREQKESE